MDTGNRVIGLYGWYAGHVFKIIGYSHFGEHVRVQLIKRKDNDPLDPWNEDHDLDLQGGKMWTGQFFNNFKFDENLKVLYAKA